MRLPALRDQLYCYFHSRLTSRPPQEESLATILLREVAMHREENKELSPDQCPEPTENKELTRKSQGEGGT